MFLAVLDVPRALPVLSMLVLLMICISKCWYMGLRLSVQTCQELLNVATHDMNIRQRLRGLERIDRPDVVWRDPQQDEDALRVFPTLTYRTNFGCNSVRRESPPYLHLHHVFLNRAHQPKGGERSTCCCTPGIYLCSNYPGNVVLIVPLVGQYDRCNGSGQCRERQLRCANSTHFTIV